MDIELLSYLSEGVVERIPLRKVGTVLPLALMSSASIVTLDSLPQRDAVFVSCLPGTRHHES